MPLENCAVSEKTSWVGSHIVDHHWGTVFSGSLVINDFPHQGNIWTGSYAKAARHEGTIPSGGGVLAGRILANSSNTQQFPSIAQGMIETTQPGVQPSDWFKNDINAIETCTANSYTGECVTNKLTGGQDESLINKIATSPSFIFL